MAVADVAVQMGPRNRRRTAQGGIALGVIAAIVLIVSLSHAKNQAAAPAQPAHASQAVARFEKNAKHLVFGMTKRQVQHIAGLPATVTGRCWLYRPRSGTVASLPVRTVGSLSMGQPGSIAARTADILKLCFVGNSLSDAYQHDSKSPDAPKGAWFPVNP
jgi:hypothetical protein